MAARGIETHLSNGKGQQFEALQQSKEIRMRNAALENQTVQISRENAQARRTRETLLGNWIQSNLNLFRLRSIREPSKEPLSKPHRRSWIS